MPIDRAVPATCASAPSGSMAFRSGIFVSAIWRAWAPVTVPTLSVRALAAPFSMPAACLSRNAVGGVLVTNVNDRSSKIVISAGITMPRWFSVAALYALQKSMIAMPCGPSAVPTGGAGVAWPAGIWMRTIAATFFLPISMASFARVVGQSSSSSLYFRGRSLGCLRRSLVESLDAPAPRLLLVLQLGDLAELELDRRLATEDVDQHLELGAVDVDLGDRAVEVGERPRDHTDLLALFELHAGSHLLLGRRAVGLGDAEDVFDFLARQRRGLRAARTDEAGDAGRVAHDAPRVVVEAHAHEHVARVHLLLHHPALPALELDHVLHRDDDLEDLVL